MFVALLGLLLLQTVVPIVAAQDHEIGYDSGTPGGSVSLAYAPHMWAGGIVRESGQGGNDFIANRMLAVRFTAEAGNVEELLGARFYIAGDMQSFNLYLFNSNRVFMSRPWRENQIVSPVYCWTVTPTSIGWVDIDVSSNVWPIYVSGDFYFAIEFTVGQKPMLGVDTIGPRSDRGWFVDNQTVTGWIEYSAYAGRNGLPDGNLMVRAVVGSPLFGVANTTANTPTNTLTNTPTNTLTNTPTNITGALPGWGIPALIALAALVVVMVGVLQMRRRGSIGLNKIVAVGLLVLLAGSLYAGYVVFRPVANTTSTTSATPRIEFGRVLLNVEIAATPTDQERGLSYRDSMDADHGMLFIFQQEGMWRFWMKDMRFSLDIIWFDSQRRAVFIEQNLPPCTSQNCTMFTPPVNAMYVLEVNAAFVQAHNVSLGDSFRFAS
jgi:uncharacterized protein